MNILAKTSWTILVVAVTATVFGENAIHGANGIPIPDLNVAVKNLKRNASSDKYSLRNVASEVMTWNREERRYKAFSLLQQKLKEYHAKPLVLMEWSLLKTRYESLFITDRVILYVKIFKNEFSYIENMPHANSNNQLYQQALELKNYKGNASLYADGANTYFFTIMQDEKIINTFAIFSLSITLNNYYGLTRYPPGSEEQVFYSQQAESTFYKDTIASAKLIINALKLIKNKDESATKK